MAAAFVPGEHVVVRYLWFKRAFWTVPATVVEDGDDRTAVWIAPRTPYRRPSQKLSMAAIAANNWTAEEHEWEGNGTLMVSRPGDAYSIWLFWDDQGRHASWYVNLEQPRKRTRNGFDSRDHQLDVVVRADRSWRWKDEDDLRDAVAVGLLSKEEAAAVRLVGETVIAALDELLPTGFETWRPDPAWETPQLQDDWEK
jgi:uncharacterized protein